MAALREEIDAACAPFHLKVFGVTQDNEDTVVLLGAGAGFWPYFTQSPEYNDGKADPLDRWSARIIPLIATSTGARDVAYPFGGPPYKPFIRWSFDSGATFASPVGMLVHAEAGFWISFRGALLFDEQIEATTPTNPCTTCARPCVTACPVGALAEGIEYNVAACKAHVRCEPGLACREGGCLVRRACPVSQSFGRDPAQSAFHMKAFVGE